MLLILIETPMVSGGSHKKIVCCLKESRIFFSIPFLRDKEMVMALNNDPLY